MRRAFLGFALWPLLLTGCASGGSAVRPESLAPATQAGSANYIVLAVNNEPDQVGARTGSTGRGYYNGAGYTVTDGARPFLIASTKSAICPA